ncbi:FAD-binding oxidoreductase [Thalassococcus sp. S3]|uniref:NAD(P)/FAD-dependent oxidoreductase n=1 Tax=Thalassococcus sp. S3 TaxID=2017482 RepID=UPI00102480A8|nr:FAD-dependent oxidoreductase [Thalassococcus sp. S3]QBF33113.1 FAD-dependent oxidoreductase [Thalassococcus sp. S3]
MADVTIRGAGIFGLSIAWICARRGARVHVVDPYGPGAGASGGIVGALAPHVPENWNAKKAFQFDSLILAEIFWRDVEGAGNQPSGYARSGRLQPVADDHALALARSRAEGASKLWQGKARWEVIAAEGLDWAPLTPTGYLIHDTLSARMHPRMACAALVAALKTLGVQVVAEAPDRGAVVWASGVAGLEALNAAFEKPVGNGVKGQGAVLALDRAGAPQLFADALHIIPHVNGTVAIGSTSERDYDDPSSTDAQLDAVIARACAAVPALGDAPIIERWAGLRPRARSRAPMLGAWPGRPGHFIANGGFKIGFGMAPKIAEVMADLVLDSKDAIPDDFRVAASL